MTDLDSGLATSSAGQRRDRRSPRLQPTSPCQRDPRAFDLDVPDLGAWHYALAACHACPILATCREWLTDEQLQHRGPHGVVWAGIAFNDYGQPMTPADLRHHYAKVRPSMTHRSVAVERSA